MRTSLLLLLATACAAVGPSNDPRPAVAPLIGAADGSDTADRDCHVILRSAARATESGLPMTECTEDGRCWLLFDAEVDMSTEALEEHTTVHLLYATEDGWLEVDPIAQTSEHATFRFGIGAIPDGMSATAMSRAAFAFIPFLRNASGARLFDHNRLPGDFESYVLEGASDWTVGEAPEVCPEMSSVPVLSFGADYDETRTGTIAAGGQVRVEYDPARLPQCFGDIYMSQATWSTNLHARFGNGHEVVTEVVVQCDDRRCTTPRTLPVVLDVPTDATEVELWFSTGGRSCGVHWDSDYGRNYHFPVRTPVDWVGAFTAKVSRAGGAPCEGSEVFEVTDGVGYGTWARIRSVTAHACFRVWQEGVTDSGGDVDVSVVCDWGDGITRHHGAAFDGRHGNDHRYRVDLRSLDPFRPYRCPDVPTFLEGGYETARATCGVEANGASWGPDGLGDDFTITFSDYPSNYWRETNCE